MNGEVRIVALEGVSIGQVKSVRKTSDTTMRVENVTGLYWIRVLRARA